MNHLHWQGEPEDVIYELCQSSIYMVSDHKRALLWLTPGDQRRHLYCVWGSEGDFRKCESNVTDRSRNMYADLREHQYWLWGPVWRWGEIIQHLENSHNCFKMTSGNVCIGSESYETLTKVNIAQQIPAFLRTQMISYNSPFQFLLQIPSCVSSCTNTIMCFSVYSFWLIVRFNLIIPVTTRTHYHIIFSTSWLDIGITGLQFMASWQSVWAIVAGQPTELLALIDFCNVCSYRDNSILVRKRKRFIPNETCTVCLSSFSLLNEQLFWWCI